jgi:ABC-2 type transport system permease protein
MENKYLRSYTRFFINSLSTGMEYRTAFIFQNIAGLVWMLSAFIFIFILFSQSSQVAGWNEKQIIFLYLTFSVTADFFNIFLKENLQQFLELIRKGQLDIYLAKPINTQFLVSLMSGQVSYSALFRFVMAIIFIIIFAPAGTSPASWLLYISLMVIGTVSVYSVIFILHTMNIWFIRLNNLTELTGQTYELSKVPLNAWPEQIKFFLTYVFPLGVLSSVAVKSLSNPPNFWSLILYIILAVLSLYISHRFFRYALHYYSSASS